MGDRSGPASPAIIFLGTPQLAVPTLRRLVTMGLPPSLVVTQPDRPAGRGMKPSPPPVKIAAEQLGLPAATMKRIRELAFDAEKKVIEIDSHMQGAFLELRRMMDEDKPDTEKIMRQVEKIGTFDIRLRQEQLRLLLQVRELLTPEQREKLRHLMLPGPPKDLPGPRHEPPGGRRPCPQGSEL